MALSPLVTMMLAGRMEMEAAANGVEDVKAERREERWLVSGCLIYIEMVSRCQGSNRGESACESAVFQSDRSGKVTSGRHGQPWTRGAETGRRGDGSKGEMERISLQAAAGLTTAGKAAMGS